MRRKKRYLQEISHIGAGLKSDLRYVFVKQSLILKNLIVMEVGRKRFDYVPLSQTSLAETQSGRFLMRFLNLYRKRISWIESASNARKYLASTPLSFESIFGAKSKLKICVRKSEIRAFEEMFAMRTSRSIRLLYGYWIAILIENHNHSKLTNLRSRLIRSIRQKIEQDKIKKHYQNALYQIIAMKSEG